MGRTLENSCLASGDLVVFASCNLQQWLQVVTHPHSEAKLANVYVMAAAAVVHIRYLLRVFDCDTRY
jgi:hypothetical protein